MTAKFSVTAEVNSEIGRQMDAITAETLAGYSGYWFPRRATTFEQLTNGWIYALCSPITGWRINSLQCAAVINQPWTTEADLCDVLKEVGGGLHNDRARSIYAFMQKVRTPAAGARILASAEENNMSQRDWRNVLAKGIDGADDYLSVLGASWKVAAFAQEICFPDTCRVVAVDTHMRRLYGDPNPKAAISWHKYHTMEDHWLAMCEQRNASPTMMRHAIWDGIQGETSTRYWSYVLEAQEESATVDA